MKDKNGFTLVELLAVIAILAILVIIALPNVINMYNEAKKRTFLTEVNLVYRESEKKYAISNASYDYINLISSKDNTKLDLSGDNLQYCVLFNNDGDIINMKVSNRKWIASLEDDRKIEDLTIDDLKEGNLDDYVCNSKNSIAKISVDVDGIINGKSNKYINAMINDIKEYNVTLTLDNYRKDYTYYDNMVDGISYQSNSLKVYIDNKIVDSSNYSVNYINNLLTVKFNNTFISTIKESSKVLIKYNKFLNEKAIVENSGNKSEMYLNCGNEKVSSEIIIAYTYAVNIISSDKDNKLLSSRNILYDENMNIINLKAISDKILTIDNNNSNIEFNSSNTAIVGLIPGKYFLSVVTAPEGYNKPINYISFIINSINDDYNRTTVKINFSTGSMLPTT